MYKWLADEDEKRFVYASENNSYAFRRERVRYVSIAADAKIHYFPV